MALSITPSELIDHIKANYGAHYRESTGVPLSEIDCSEVAISDHGFDVRCTLVDQQSVETTLVIQGGTGYEYEYLVNDLDEWPASTRNPIFAPIEAFASAFSTRNWSDLYQSQHVSPTLRDSIPVEQFAQADVFAEKLGAIQSIQVKGLVF
ncbi:MAG: hypothetical protein R3200_11095, partial [Xanthomonadales bacterium]|nr:hypothetical protein [Xanthomonadales bacterium]